MYIELDQFWLCSNSILGLHIIDEIIITKTMVEMTKCYFKYRIESVGLYPVNIILNDVIILLLLLISVQS